MLKGWQCPVSSQTRAPSSPRRSFSTVPNVQRYLMRRGQKLKGGGECLGCLMRNDSNELCHRGTNSGDCIPCGRCKSTCSPFSFEGFFNYELTHCLLSLARTPEYGALDSDENRVEIDFDQQNGTPDYILEYELRTCDPALIAALKLRFDEIVSKSCIPRIVSKAETTNFATSAWLGRRYLALLVPCIMVQEAENFTNGLRIFSLIVTRLDEIISEVVNGFKKERVPGDERYWSELTMSLAVLYFGLLHAQEGLENQALQPICIHAELPRLLIRRVQCTLETLKLLLCHRGLTCDPEWLANFDCSLEDLRTSLIISSPNIRTVPRACLMSMRSPSADSSGSGLLDSSYTPSLIEATPSGNPTTFNHDITKGSQGFKTGFRLSVSPSIEVLPLPWNQIQGSKVYEFLDPPPEPPPRIFRSHNTIPPPFAVRHGTSNNQLNSSIFREIHTSLDHGFQDFKSLELNGVQVIEVEQTPYHVTHSLPYMYGFEDGTSVSECRDLYLDQHHTQLDGEEFAENPINSLYFCNGESASYEIDQVWAKF